MSEPSSQHRRPGAQPCSAHLRQPLSQFKDTSLALWHGACPPRSTCLAQHLSTNKLRPLLLQVSQPLRASPTASMRRSLALGEPALCSASTQRPCCT